MVVSDVKYICKNWKGEGVEQYQNNQQASIVTYEQQQDQYYGDKCAQVASYGASSAEQVGPNEWPMIQTYSTPSFVNGITYSFTDSQSDGDITPSGSVIDGASRWN